MTSHREVLARAAAARLIAAACRDATDLWNRQERLHEAAVTNAEARVAAAPLLKVCGRCPIVAECETWAVADKYTGIAAATAWSNGNERPNRAFRPAPRERPLAS